MSAPRGQSGSLSGLIGFVSTRPSSRAIRRLEPKMQIGSFDFRHVCRIEPEREADGSVKRFMPQLQYANERSLPLSRYGHGPFCKFKIPANYALSGVYALQIASSVNYIGECANLSARYNAGYGNISPRNCFKGGQDTNCRLNNLIFLASSAWSEINLWFHQTASYKAAELELLAIQKWIWNRK
jgi:hypothetical protein